MNGVEIEVVEEFKYLGSIIRSSGSNTRDVVERVASSSRAFGKMKRAVFQNRALSTRTKHSVYKVVVLGTLLYGSEAWTTKREEMKKLESLHNRCLRGVLGITRVQQWDERITSSQVRERFRMVETVEETLLRRMRWLGHMATMADTRLPKQALFGRLRKARPFHGT